MGVQRRSIAGITGLAALTALVGAGPGIADTVALPEALQAVTSACTAARVALVANGGSLTSSGAVKVFAGARFEVDDSSGQRVVDSQAGTFGSLAGSGVSGKTRKKALAYLGQPGAAWWVNAGRFQTDALGWSASFEQARDGALPVDGSCAQALDGAFDEVERTGNSWTFNVAMQGPVTVVIDSEGRLAQGWGFSFDYSAREVTVPTGAIGYRGWRKASEAAGLRPTLRDLARQVASSVNSGEPDLQAIAEAARAAVPPDRVVAIKVRQLRAGTLLYARNPYTRTYHAWRVYLKNGMARATRVAP